MENSHSARYIEPDATHTAKHNAMSTVTHIDCDGCRMRGPACSDCVVGVLLSIETTTSPRTGTRGGRPGQESPVEEAAAVSAATGDGGRPHAAPAAGGFVNDMPWLDGDDWVGQLWLTDDEQRAVEALAASGLTPPLRLVREAS